MGNIKNLTKEEALLEIERLKNKLAKRKSRAAKKQKLREKVIESNNALAKDKENGVAKKEPAKVKVNRAATWCYSGAVQAEFRTFRTPISPMVRICVRSARTHRTCLTV